MTLTSDSPASVVSSRALSLALGQGGELSGGTPALSWAADSIEDGGTLTISTDGTNDFGAKVTSVPVVWDMGSDFRFLGKPLNGHANASDGDSPGTLGVVGSGSNGEISLSRPHRHSRIDRHYFADATTDVFIGYSDLLRSGTASRRHYSCFRMRLPIDLRTVRQVSIVSSSGVFNEGASGELGEDLTVSIGGTDYSGTLIAIFDGKMAFGVEGVSITSGTGSFSVAGVSSGAAATLDSSLAGYAASSAAKLYRINQEAQDGVLSVLQLGVEQFWIESNLSGTDEIGMSRFAHAPDYSAAVASGEWFFVEMTQDWSDGAALTGTARLVGSQGQSFNEIAPKDGSGNWKDLPVLLLGIGLDSSVDHKLNVDFGEVYVDETPQRVAIGDNADYSLCSNIEIQYVKSWSNSEIKAEIYQGAFDSLRGKHLFIFNDQNQPTYVGQLWQF